MRPARGPAIPLADAARFRSLARRTTLVRAVLAIGLLALLGATLAEALRLREERRFLPAGSSGVIVLDVSASISPDTYRRIQATVAELAASREHYGLVLFSDVAYEALPPGTPAAELAPLVRWFEPRSQEQSNARVRNPWSASFAGGTSISSGLARARSALRRDGIERGSVLLVSDLADDPTDLPALRRELAIYRREGIEARVVGLDPALPDRQLYSRLLGPDALLDDSGVAPEGLDEPRTIISADVAAGLVAAAAVLLLLLALNEHWCARLRWRRRPATEEAR